MIIRLMRGSRVILFTRESDAATLPGFKPPLWDVLAGRAWPCCVRSVSSFPLLNNGHEIIVPTIWEITVPLPSQITF